MSKTWKKFLALFMSAVLMLGLFTACGSGTAETTTEADPTEPAEEAKVLKVLTLGHSLATDTGFMLNMIFGAEGTGRYEEVVIATLYYSGCKLSEHVDFLTRNAPEYRLYLSSSATPEKPPEIMEGVTMLDALRFDYWDIIVMQGGPWEIDADSGFTGGNVQKIQNYVNENKLNPLAVYAWHMPWALPADVDLLMMYPKEPNSHYQNYLAYNLDKSAYYEAMVGCVERHILTDETFQFVIPTGTTVQNAWSSYLEDKDLHRDYAHASDLSRVMTSYTWYCMLMGIDHLDELKVQAIPKQFLKSTEDKTQDRVLTQMEQLIILESVNNALKSPMEMTQSQYTEAPTE